MTISNAAKAERFYGLHMVEGVAEYQDGEGAEPYRILIGEDCLKSMDASFEGLPVYVRHVDDVPNSLEDQKKACVGRVIRSFYNPPDGKHWAEFIVDTEEGLQALKQGWRLSNAYVPKEWAGGGRWHNVDYQKEVMRGEFEHLAIVPNPRYEESIVLTPEDFKAYNAEKESELLKLANSKEERSMFNWFKKGKVENAAEIEAMTVVLKSGTEKSVAQLVNDAEAAEAKAAEEKKSPQMANMDHMVKCDAGEMSVKDLVEKHNELLKKQAGGEGDDEAKKKAAAEAEAAKKKESAAAGDDEEAKKKALELAAHEEKELEAKKKQDEAAMAEKKKNESYFESLKNAGSKQTDTTVELSEDRVARGKARYGSGS